MGKHGKPVKCGMCKGSGKMEISDDGKIRKIPCSGCGGSGSQG